MHRGSRLRSGRLVWILHVINPCDGRDLRLLQSLSLLNVCLLEGTFRDKVGSRVGMAVRGVLHDKSFLKLIKGCGVRVNNLLNHLRILIWHSFTLVLRVKDVILLSRDHFARLVFRELGQALLELLL